MRQCATGTTDLRPQVTTKALGASTTPSGPPPASKSHAPPSTNGSAPPQNQSNGQPRRQLDPSLQATEMALADARTAPGRRQGGVSKAGCAPAGKPKGPSSNQAGLGEEIRGDELGSDRSPWDAPAAVWIRCGGAARRWGGGRARRGPETAVRVLEGCEAWGRGERAQDGAGTGE